MQAEVIVVGAGPVGLMLAGELRLGGVDVVVADRLREPMGESRASQLNARTMELFDQRGLLSRLDPPQQETRGHFGGMSFSVAEVASPHAGFWKLPQYRTEAMLQSWIIDLGVPLLRGHELRALDMRADGVDAVLDTGSGSLRLSGDYLVGCDGEDSTVRRLAGFTGRDKPADRELLRADVVDIEIPDRRFERHERGLAIAATRAGVTRVMMHEFGHSAADRTAPPAFPEVVETWAKITGEDIGAGLPVWVDAFDDATRLVSEYRRDRVFLAGDAAHRMMPIGGQAINVGLQDAVNLGWKLAGAMRGWAPPGLLDSYHAERRPVAERMVGLVEAQTLLQLGDSRVDAVRTVFAELLELDPVRAHLVALLSGLDVRYDVELAGHPLPGNRMPEVELRNGSVPDRTTAFLHPAAGVLFDFGDVPELHAVAEKWAGRVRAVRVSPEASPGFAAALVRPDGHVAWADGTTAELHEALSRWFGAPDKNRE